MKNTTTEDTELFPKEETKKFYHETIALLIKKVKEKDEKELMSSILYFRGLL